MATTKIEWADRVWNPITGCTPITPGCDRCYARRMATRLAGRCGYPKENPFQVTFHKNKLTDPFDWRKSYRIFVGSMGDMFHENVPFDWLRQVFAWMHTAKRHTYMVLTKRPERMLAFLKDYSDWIGFNAWPREYQHVWLGVSVENQEAADERIPWLLKCPAAVRFVSCEPLLGAIKLSQGHRGWMCERCGGTGIQEAGRWSGKAYDAPAGLCDSCKGCGKLGGIDWIIASGETGPGARPAHHGWFRSLRDQCQAVSVPFFFKGWGEWASYRGSGIGILSQEARRINDCGLDITSCPELWCDDLDMTDDYVYKIGKKRSSRLLDGREWNEYPEVNG